MKSTIRLPSVKSGAAICYSGYREHQSPSDQTYPSLQQIHEDLLLLAPHWQHLRLYDCSLHAHRVLQVIAAEGLDFEVMLGAYLGPELNNPACPWGGVYSDAVLDQSKQENERELRRLVDLANQYPAIVSSVAVGNEATVDWTDHLVSVPQMIAYVRWVKERVEQPISFCENYVPWQYKLRDLVPELDFISIHTYPVWEYKSIHEALAYTQANVLSVSTRYPDKPIVVSEAGWTTGSNGRGIRPESASEDLQAVYCRELMQWSKRCGVLVYVFEAFDEPWKGSPDPMEPEKHWGLYTVDRRPKKVVHDLFSTPCF